MLLVRQQFSKRLSTASLSFFRYFLTKKESIVTFPVREFRRPKRTRNRPSRQPSFASCGENRDAEKTPDRSNLQCCSGDKDDRSRQRDHLSNAEPLRRVKLFYAQPGIERKRKFSRPERTCCEKSETCSWRPQNLRKGNNLLPPFLNPCGFDH